MGCIMTRTLGILVNTNRHFHYLYELARAAYKKGIETQIFFTGSGVLLTKEAEFSRLVGLAKLSV